MLTRKTCASSMLLKKTPESVWSTPIFSDEKKWNLDGYEALLARFKQTSPLNKTRIGWRRVRHGLRNLYIYQQNNASIHVSKHTMDFFLQNKKLKFSPGHPSLLLEPDRKFGVDHEQKDLPK
ncbi:LOW QUALITY PROTEIN: hypothetical protein PHMEG_00025005 [Phytophthora megakarya]|uniref:Uncharacterized protein n=1 Tax=Phytophthora megakarya TaxID=4795 RepID=A0A225VDU4_9STRA|nr:LOW QUALITY PROTEIN: hypothetical protein PHMEG_00025005 [Phytophthora megakarya]